MKNLKIPILSGVSLLILICCSKDIDSGIYDINDIPRDKNGFYIDGVEHSLSKGVIEYIESGTSHEGSQFSIALLSAGLNFDGEKAEGNGDFFDITFFSETWDDLKSGSYSFKASGNMVGCFYGMTVLGFDVQSSTSAKVYLLTSGSIMVNKIENMYELIMDCRADEIHWEDGNTLSTDHKILTYYKGDLLMFGFLKEEPNACKIDPDTMDFTFGIDYDHPEKYLLSGEQSDLSEAYFAEVKSALGTPTANIAGVLRICHWVNQNFTFTNAGGAMIGKKTVDELFEIKTFYGCHSLALLISSILRSYGFPAIMIETADVQWGYDFNRGSTQSFAGHVMSEVYVQDTWILFDNNCTYVEDYEYMNPYISETNNAVKGYFVFAKGIDTWGYSNRDEEFTHDELIYFSDNIYCYEELFITVNYDWDN